ncbi:hypothetical protein [Kitasatospora viridis]|uniref:hypothetical protein n=1 Tax=Kitasatospora viridis TaxID=281105 RepID=UPI0011A1454F|nr:hypothetical protein [Kitasatospora viridis]
MSDRVVAYDRAVQAGPCHYPVLVRIGRQAGEGLAEAVRGLGGARFLVVAASGAPARQLGAAVAALALVGKVLVVRGERVALRLPVPTPDTVVVAVGGGRTVRSVLGWARRGQVVAVPTTLAAMSEAYVLPGSDGPRAPALLWCRPDLLDGPQHAGLYPLLRDVLAICPYHLDSVAGRLRADGRYEPAVLASFVALCQEAQAGVLTFDPLGQGPAAVLRYGQGTAQGLLLAALLGERLGLLGAEGVAAHLRLLARAGLATELGPGPGAEVARELVLLRALGRPRVAGGSVLTPVPAEEVRALRGFAAAPVPAPEVGRVDYPVPSARAARPTVAA